MLVFRVSLEQTDFFLTLPLRQLIQYKQGGIYVEWFMWQLQEDMYAASAFTGDEPEIMRNSLYQDQLIDLN